MSGNKSLPNKGFSVGQILFYAAMTVFVVIYNYPLIWMLVTGFKNSHEVYAYPPNVWPRNPVFSSFVEAWTAADWPRYMGNTLFVATAVPLLKILLSAFAGFVLTYKFKGAKIILILVLGTMMIPDETTLVAKYLLMKQLGWVNTYWALIVPGATGAFSIFLYRQFFMTLPRDLADAAAMDGCGDFRYLLSIGLPLAKSTSLTVGLLSFIDEWNSTLWPLIIINNDKMRMVQIALKVFSDDGGTTWNQLMAACCFVSLPVIALFVILQKQFIAGVASTGIKG
ncbi:MAG: carbohydrate ABC transporter permease [Treponemataceae bacterium]